MCVGNDVPVLVTMFNRPDHASRVIDVLAKTRPRRLFLAVDGPRSGVAGDEEGASGCRELVSRIDWDCELHTRFRETNLGCREGMIDGVSWFFDHVESGVVLEDDCVPDDDFFRYAAETLARYGGEPGFMQLSGYAHLENPRGEVYFLPLTSSWGWGTTRSVWRNFLEKRSGYADDFENHPELHAAFDLGGRYPYSKMFLRNLRGKVSSWAILFYWHVFRAGGLVAYPAQSLIRNIGFDGSGSHCNARSGDGGMGEPPRRHGGILPEEMTCDEPLFEKVRQHLAR